MDRRQVFVFNFPLDITFKSTSPFGCKLIIKKWGLIFYWCLFFLLSCINLIGNFFIINNTWVKMKNVYTSLKTCVTLIAQYSKKKFVDTISCDICCFIIPFRASTSVELLWLGCFRSWCSARIWSCTCSYLSRKVEIKLNI